MRTGDRLTVGECFAEDSNLGKEDLRLQRWSGTICFPALFNWPIPRLSVSHAILLAYLHSISMRSIVALHVAFLFVDKVDSEQFFETEPTACIGCQLQGSHSSCLGLLVKLQMHLHR